MATKTPTVLAGAKTYDVQLPTGGHITYRKGEAVHPDHLALVPEADQALFTAPAQPPKEAEPAKTPKK